MKRTSSFPPTGGQSYVILTALVALLFLHAHSALAASVTWTKRIPQGPVPRIEDTLVYDTLGRRLFMFGGYDLNWNRMNDMWQYDPAAKVWTDVTPLTGSLPQRRSGHAMAFDPSHGTQGKIIVFGGLTDSLTYLGDIWEWDVANKTWTNLTPAGTKPTGRQGARLVYEADATPRMILVGGTDGNHFFPYPQGDLPGENVTWVWDLNTHTWTSFPVPSTTTSFAGRAFPGVAFNSATGRVNVFGGVGFAAGNPPANPVLNFNDTWELNGTTWTNITPASGNPPGRGWTQLAYDSASSRMVMFGGFSLAGFSYGDTWSRPGVGGNWSEIATASPGLRDSHGMVYDAFRNKIVVFGGYLPDVIELTGSAWALATPRIDWPPGQDQHAMAYDTDRNVVFMYGGGSLESWQLTVPTATWGWYFIGGPNGRTGATVAYDRSRRKMVLFGGRQRASGTAGSTLGDTWEWDTAAHTWVNVSPGTSPSARDDHAMAYDAAHNQTVLFGGRNAGGTPLGDTWVRTGTTWANVATPAGLTPRFGHAMAYDAARSRVVLFGGQNAGGQKLNDVWEWNGAGWQQKFPGVSPPARAFAALSSMDAAAPGVALFGGLGAGQLNDTWIWNGTLWTQANAVGTVPTARQRPVMVYDAASHRLVLYGGSDSRGISTELWTSTIVADSVPTSVPAGDFDGDGKSDVTVFRPSNGAWYTLQSSTNFTGSFYNIWGQPGDIPVPGDFDGDGRNDVVVYRPSNGAWYILKSSTNFTGFVYYIWGQPGDVPVQGDFDGDGKADVVVYRPSNGAWYILQSSTNFTGSVYYIWGLNGDIPVPGDFDGDGKADVVVYRPSNGAWYILQSSTNFTGSVYYIWGLAGDIPVQGNFDGDGKADVVVYRPSNGAWYILQSSTNFTGSVFYIHGQNGDIPVPGDFDGDGKTDVVVYRPSNGAWYIRQSSTNFTGSVFYIWGQNGDIPVLKRP